MGWGSDDGMVSCWMLLGAPDVGMDFLALRFRDLLYFLDVKLGFQGVLVQGF